jgi:hypothetical protein
MPKLILITVAGVIDNMNVFIFLSSVAYVFQLLWTLFSLHDGTIKTKREFFLYFIPLYPLIKSIKEKYDTLK